MIILGVAESDAHAVANHLIAMQLREHGFDVLNLGVCTPLSDFAAAHLAHPETDAVVVGSLNGHAKEDLSGLSALRAKGLLDCPVIVGGNLSVGSRKSTEDQSRLHELGVDHVLTNVTELLFLLDLLHSAKSRQLVGV